MGTSILDLGISSNYLSNAFKNLGDSLQKEGLGYIRVGYTRVWV